MSSPDQWRLLRRVDTTQLNNLFTVNPTTVITVRYGFNRFPNYSYDVSQGYNLTRLDFSPALVNQMPKAALPVPRRPDEQLVFTWAWPTTIRFTCMRPTTSPPASRSIWDATA